MALIKDEILKIFWTSYYHNGIYVLKTKHTCACMVVEKIQYESDIYKILWGSIFKVVMVKEKLGENK